MSSIRQHGWASVRKGEQGVSFLSRCSVALGITQLMSCCGPFLWVSQDRSEYTGARPLCGGGLLKVDTGRIRDCHVCSGGIGC